MVLSFVFPREEQQAVYVPQNPVPSGSSLSTPYVSTVPELLFLLCLLFVLHLIQGKAASLSQYWRTRLAERFLKHGMSSPQIPNIYIPKDFMAVLEVWALSGVECH